jgi:very-short-patch-repair endonuclease
MEKQCEICNKDYKPRRKEQKFCSVECQHESYRKIKVERIECTCLFCDKKFYKLQSNRGKYCSKKCSDNHKKITYLGENNPSYNRKMSDDELKMRSEITKKLWEDEGYRSKIKKSMNLFFEKNGYWPGNDKDSMLKKKETMVKKFGVSHNWMGKYGERKCDKTTLDIYGKTSTQMLIEYSHFFGKKTDIEKMFEVILEELEIPFQCKFRIYDKNKVNFWFREYDFLILNTNILIEVDGDYWHGNQNIFEELTEFQKSIQINDEIKENFAKNKGYNVIRFWGSDIKKNNQEIKNIIREIWEKLK